MKEVSYLKIQHGGKYILQFSKTEWAKEEDVIKRADMIEVKLGQGACLGWAGKSHPEI